MRAVEAAVAVLHLEVVGIGRPLAKLILVRRHLDAEAIRPRVVAVETQADR